MIAAACLLAYARHVAGRAVRQARRRVLARRARRDCWHPRLTYHESDRWIFRCRLCDRPLNQRPMGARVDG